METLQYLMIIEPSTDEFGEIYGAYFPDLPGCASTGRDLEELRANAKEALEVYIEALKATGQPVPPARMRVEPIRIEAS